MEDAIVLVVRRIRGEEGKKLISYDTEGVLVKFAGK